MKLSIDLGGGWGYGDAVMRTLTIKSKQLTASQYLNQCTARRNRTACAWIEFREACFRLACYSTATIALVIVGVNCIFSFLAI